MAFFTDFPNIIPLNKNLSEFDGFLTVKDEDIRIRISITDDKSVEIRGNWSDMRVFNCQDSFTYKKTVSSLSDLSVVLRELQTTWEKALPDNKDDATLKAPCFYSSIVSQVHDLRPENVEEISDDLKELKLVVLDKSDRKHFLNIHFPDKFPDDEMQVNVSLPLKFVLEKSLPLKELIEKFESELERYQLFWDCMDNIDENYCVVEPQIPTREDRLRKISINNKVSLTVIVDPIQPKNIPEFTFSGPDEEIIIFDNLASTKKNLWDTSTFPITNFVNMLEVEFPRKMSETHEELLQPCAICYSYLLENAIPTESCICKQRFHRKCLIEWLSSIPNARHTFNCYKGVCPYCGQEITIQEK